MKVCVLGLGYVGLPLAIEFEKHYDVIGFDINEEKINLLKKGQDPTQEVGDDAIKKSKIDFTNDKKKINSADFVVIAVPTPIDSNNKPNLKYLISASELVGENMRKGATVIYESTVFPGCTEEECLPILEAKSRLKLSKNEFGLGYSPERINPGDKIHTVSSIVKVISGNNKKVLNKIEKLYSKIISAGLHRAENIKVAEAAKVIENIQRDLNIALMNELSIIFEKLNINTYSVLEAAGTKWNFHKYTPGLVGGHCIGVDPYYLTYKAQTIGYEPKIILSGRKVNDDMHLHVSNLIEKKLDKVKGKKILILGLTFKENVPDYRNSRAKQLILELKSKGAHIKGYDPYIEKEIMKKEFNCEKINEINEEYDFYVLLSPHKKMLKIIPENVPLLDIKNKLKRQNRNYYTL